MTAARDCLLDPLGCLTSAAGSGASDAANTAWDAVCKSFADAAAQLLKAFGQAFAALPTVNLETAGISSTYGISLAIAAVVAALLVFTGVIRTAWTHDGSGIAQAVTGTGSDTTLGADPFSAQAASLGWQELLPAGSAG